MRRSIGLIASAIAMCLAASSAPRADDQIIRIGVLNDMSGPYADFQGPGSLLAAQMAVEDYGGRAAGRKIEILSADHQNRPDVGAAIARRNGLRRKASTRSPTCPIRPLRLRLVRSPGIRTRPCWRPVPEPML